MLFFCPEKKNRTISTLSKKGFSLKTSTRVGGVAGIEEKTFFDTNENPTQETNPKPFYFLLMIPHEENWLNQLFFHETGFLS